MKRIFAFGNILIGLMIIAITLIIIYLPNYNILEFLNENLIFYVVFLLISGVWGLILNQKFILYVSFGCAFMLTLFLKYNSNTDLKLPKPNNQPTLGLTHINLSSVTSGNVLERMAKDKSNDVISFQEVTPDWDDILKEIFLDSFPFYFMEEKLDYQGKAFFSKHRFIVQPDIPLNNNFAKFIILEKGKEKYHLISTYLTPPLNEKDKSVNEKELMDLTGKMIEIPNAAFVFGELNRVYWAKPIIQFRKKSLLMNSRRNVQLSFKTSYNHIFYTGDMECYHFEDIFDDDNLSIGCRGLYQKKKLIVKSNRKGTNED
ncbi:MAG: endonuclease/exonuclease/phosphatase family protein [Saprospiraceae bacterium]|nr:endonuclease/exonuclease/phosphatase family protein [Saprospiraceae bacterium]